MKKRTLNLDTDMLIRRYQRSGRKGKTQLLDELCNLHGYLGDLKTLGRIVEHGCLSLFI
jgi:hypothetical protein